MPDAETSPAQCKSAPWCALRTLRHGFDADAEDGRPIDRNQFDWLYVLPSIGMHLTCFGVLWMCSRAIHLPVASATDLKPATLNARRPGRF